jgi:surface antigen-like variable number repeat protein
MSQDPAWLTPSRLWRVGDATRDGSSRVVARAFLTSRAVAKAVQACAIVASLVAAAPASAQDTTPQPQPIVREVQVRGAKELSEAAVLRAGRIVVGEALPGTLDGIRERIEHRYHEEGYSFARVTTAFDADTRVLTLTIDEGVIDAIEFEGVDPKFARTLADEFALRAGDVFNRTRALHALDAVLRQTRGAIRRSRQTFDVIDRNGQHVLVIGLREPAGRFRLVPDLGEREDWFSSVDGFVPSLGFGAAVFNHETFNHAFVAGHISIRTARSHVGYALGFERPLFGKTKLFLGGELHDLTASDDQWQVSSAEASLAAFGPRRSYRDYYRRRGVQIGGALRVHPQVELLFAWRGERHEPLLSETDFSLWNDDEPFRPNRSAADGRLNAVIVGASIDGDGFDRESLEATYRRHQLETPFGERLRGPDTDHDLTPRWRIDWTSEISAPDALQSDFDFRRHIVSGRARVALSRHQEVSARAIGGWSDGVLPPQRQFAVGGIGSVHGYGFKEQVGDSLALLNLEYSLGWHGGLHGIGFFDLGHTTIRQSQTLTAQTAGRPWLKGVGFGIGIGDVRIDFGYKLDAVPSSLQVLLRFGRTF